MGEIIQHPATAPDELGAPAHLKPEHDISRFQCGDAALDDWLRKRAAGNESSGGSRTYVVCSGTRVVGYYCLANGGVGHEAAIGRIRRNMPDPIPVMVIGRLAVDRDWQRKGIGRAMLRDAIIRTAQAAEIAGIRAILVHAKSDKAKAFYERWGFRSSDASPMTLMIAVAETLR